VKLQRSAAVSLLFLAALAAPAWAGPESFSWVSWDAGLQQARQQQRPVLVDVYTQWCGWCKRMDRDVYSREDVRDYLGEKFVTVKLDAEASEGAKYEGRAYTSRTLASQFRITSYPTTLFLKPNGEHLVSVPGYIAPEKFLLLLRYIRDGHFERGVPWEDFAAKRGK
jgi:thioredoxin-related protein